ncbi:MAG: hypothetical protein ABS52_08550 [Gemmatimonadetes bacterium SCN 70-22]|nr:MAG: hypothetical protein ABS52_08550 [Gemmatimonadetes bacterium SCN 70-22]
MPFLGHPRRSLYRVGIVTLLLTACSRRNTGPYSEPALRAELLSRVARDQAVRDTFQVQLRQTGTITPALFASMSRVDSANFLWLREVVRSQGFPTHAQVGRDGVAAATLLVQHADAAPDFQGEMLPTFEALHRSGDVTGQELALLTDRVAKARGRPQRYGSQTTIVDGKVIIDPIEDSAGVDARRRALGLPPLAEYKRVLDSLYAREGGR